MRNVEEIRESIRKSKNNLFIPKESMEYIIITLKNDYDFIRSLNKETEILKLVGEISLYYLSLKVNSVRVFKELVDGNFIASGEFEQVLNDDTIQTLMTLVSDLIVVDKFLPDSIYEVRVLETAGVMLVYKENLWKILYEREKENAGKNKDKQ